MDSNLTETTALNGWRRRSPQPSLPEANSSLPIGKGLGFWRILVSKLTDFSPEYRLRVGNWRILLKCRKIK